ncbi:MAG: DUF4105 domain-containing protein [Spirochaetia bacterium]|nr:DUF4105 domain-containing protein [Spirochaetia bacterium]
MLDIRARSPRALVLIVVLFSLCSTLAADDDRIRDMDISLITILPGKALYSSFGHTCIRILDNRTGRDILYNYGLSANPFDIKFALGMLQGRMEFLVAAGKTADVLRFYREVENRTILEQTLRLDEQQRRALEAALAHDALPENRVYNYRYFSDNCTTRIAVMLDAITGGNGSPAAAEEPKTMRASIAEVLDGRPYLSLALGTLFGPLTDKRASGTESIFLPEQLMRWAAQAENQTSEGSGSLVGATGTLYEATLAETPAITATPLAMSVIMVGLAILLVVFRGKPRIMAALFDALFFSIIAVTGLAIVLFWVFARYQEAAWNINLLWAGVLPIMGLGLSSWKRLGQVSLVLFRIATISACVVVFAGGFGLQTIPAELRLLAAATAIRCAARGRLIPGRLVSAERRPRSSAPSE